MAFENSKLYQAVKNNEPDSVHSLLAAGEDATIRNSDGKTLLHVTVETNASKDIFKALLEKVDFSVRDDNGNTVADLIFSGDYPEEAETLLKNHVKSHLLSSDLGRLDVLLNSGWHLWPITLEEAKEKSEHIGEFVEKLPDIKSRVSGVHKAIFEGNLLDLKGHMEHVDKKRLAESADHTGLPPLHKAVALSQPDIVEYLAKEFNILELRDNMERTALHYAGGSRDAGHMYKILTDAGSDETPTDLSGKTPKEYFDNPNLLPGEKTEEKVREILERPLLTTKTKQPSRPPSAKQGSKPGSPEATDQKDKKTKYNMYISADTEKIKAPPPSTVDGKYVAEHLGTALTMALAEIAERRPWDPIEYLAQWLYKYRKNLDYNQRQLDLLEQIRKEEEDKVREQENKIKRRQEMKRIQQEERKRLEEEEEERKRKEQEELQRKAKEAALAQRPGLETVAEEGEEDAVGKDRNEDGQTELHKLAAQQGADLVALINLGYNLADRDAQNKTPRDIAEEHGIQENTDAIDNYVKSLIEKSDYERLHQLLLEGYDKLPAVIEKMESEGRSEELEDFIASVPDIQEKISGVYKAIQSGVLRDVSQAMDRKKLPQARDAYGRSALHFAVLVEQAEAAEYIAKTFPVTLKARDNLGRTPLHYGAALSEEMAAMLTANGADESAKDVKQRLPSYYKADPSEIQALKGTIPVFEPSERDAPSPTAAPPTEQGEESAAGEGYSDPAETDAPTEQTAE